MEEVEHKAYLASVQSRINAVKYSSALAMAAPLESRSRSSATTTDSKKPTASASEPKRIPNQKLGILSALLGIGALRPALAILSKHRWMVDAHPEIADLLLRILRHSVDPLYQSNQVHKERSPSYTQPKARYTGSGTLQTPARERFDAGHVTNELAEDDDVRRLVVVELVNDVAQDGADVSGVATV